MWGEYQAERGRLFRSRSDMADALDFIGWYNHKTWRALGIVRTDARSSPAASRVSGAGAGIRCGRFAADGSILLPFFTRPATGF